MREHDFDAAATMRRGRYQFDDAEPDQLSLKRGRRQPALREDPDRPEGFARSAQLDAFERSAGLDVTPEAGQLGGFSPLAFDQPVGGGRWSSWDGAEQGPAPLPDWVRTEHGAVDTELGILKSGKEADVFLVRRAVPGSDQVSMLAAKRYRDGDHRLFHRDAGYLEGRRVRRSREMRAMTNRTSFGKQLIAGQWAAAEFGALSHLWQVGQQGGQICVPYPVQLIGTELMLEFIGDWETGEAAPRLAQVRTDRDTLDDLWHQLTAALSVLARAQVAHGDLSPYNTLVHQGRLVLIDLPQIVDVVANPQGADFIARDVRNMANWFLARGLSVDADALIDNLLHEAGLR